MVEISSRWILQEIFVDPLTQGEIEDGELYLKVASSGQKEGEGLLKVVVEISGSIISGELQVANFRFVNVTEVEGSARRKRSIVKKVEERRKAELLSILPMYLIKSGLTVRKVRSEL